MNIWFQFSFHIKLNTGIGKSLANKFFPNHWGSANLYLISVSQFSTKKYLETYTPWFYHSLSRDFFLRKLSWMCMPMWLLNAYHLTTNTQKNWKPPKCPAIVKKKNDTNITHTYLYTRSQRVELSSHVTENTDMIWSVQPIAWQTHPEK